MNNVLAFNAERIRKPSTTPVYRLQVSGIEPGHRVILWQDHYQRFVLDVSKYGQVNFFMEPLGRAG